MKRIDWEEVVAFLDNQPHDRDDGASHRLADALRAGLVDSEPEPDWDKFVPRLRALMMQPLPQVPTAGVPCPIQYAYNKAGSIVLPPGAPFDGKEMLIELAEGWVQARWADTEVQQTQDGPEHYGFCWVCLDDSYGQQELDSAKRWMPLPPPAEG